MTDYELYKLLEENNYAPTKRNLYILKEGIIEGDIELIDEELTPLQKAKETYKNSKFTYKLSKKSTDTQFQNTMKNRLDNAKAAYIEAKRNR